MNELSEFILAFLKILSGSHAADEVRSLSVLVAVDTEKLLFIKCGENLAETGLATTCLTHKKHWLFVLEAFVY